LVVGQDGHVITVLGPDELPECCDLAQSRGWWREERKWRLLFDVGTVYGLRDDDGALIGTTVLTRYGTAAAISMVLIAQAYERRGLGGRLMRRALDDAGDTVVFLNATSFGQQLYQRLGFSAIGTTYTHFGEPAPIAPSGRTRLAGPDDLAAIEALDARVTGCDRAHLVRRLPAFLSGVRVAERDGVLSGYAGIWDNEGTTMVGPVLAADEDEARALVADLLAGVSGPVRLDLQTPGLRALADGHGAEVRFSTAVMVRGAAKLPGDRDRWFVPVMQALG
jgi:GNAT superfamily N-acetyltransferase